MPGMAPRYRIILTLEERVQLEALTRSSKTNAPKFIHAQALLLCDTGPDGTDRPWKVADAAAAPGISARTIEHFRGRFVEEGLKRHWGAGPQSGTGTPLSTANSRRV